MKSKKLTEEQKERIQASSEFFGPPVFIKDKIDSDTADEILDLVSAGIRVEIVE